ncbi:MAG TPA: DUF6325 family protein [Acidimicrobiia bacterium]|nr:DUF6325 family protein [Acidimicrobiia bacterium]
MIKHGPVDVVVLALGAPKFDGRILSELQRQTEEGTIRVLDAMVLFKDEAGACFTLDMEDLPEADLAALSFIDSETRGMFDAEDADTLWEGMVPGSAVVALAIEHTWAVDLVNAFHANDVEVALHFRVPAPIVDEAFASVEAAS